MHLTVYQQYPQDYMQFIVCLDVIRYQVTINEDIVNYFSIQTISVLHVKVKNTDTQQSFNKNKVET